MMYGLHRKSQEEVLQKADPMPPHCMYKGEQQLPYISMQDDQVKVTCV